MVQCDFDGTIATGIVSAIIRDAYGPPDWRRMEEDFVSGKLSVEESNIRQFAQVRASREEMEGLVRRRARLRPGFREFVEYCRRAGLRLAVVSSGFDLYIRPVLEEAGLDDLEVYCGQAQVEEAGVRVWYRDPRGRPLTAGFKEAYLRHFKAQGYAVIYVGDGLSDLTPAREADHVIARDTLAELCRQEGIAFRLFEDFFDVRRHVEELADAAGHPSGGDGGTGPESGPRSTRTDPSGPAPA